MTRRCSHCSHNGHNSRTCPTRTGTCGGVRLFGVRLTDGSIIKKSASMGNLSLHYNSSSSAAASPNPGSPGSDPVQEPGLVPDGYLSDDPAHATCSSSRRAERKKGVPWTEEEHRLFLLGLQKLGKGDWRGISRNYVITRTPTQVASHAQKYFIRQCNATRRKRRSSLFDMVPEVQQDEPTIPEDHFMLPPSQVEEHDNPNTFPSLKLSLNSEYEPMEATSDEKTEEIKEKITTQSVENPIIPTFFPTFLPVPFSLWPSNAAPIKEEEEENNKMTVFRPIPIVPKESVKVDELVGMSQLSIKESQNQNIESSSLTLNLLEGGSSRPSAFHTSIPRNESDFGNEKGGGTS